MPLHPPTSADEAQVIKSRYRNFKIPFGIAPADRHSYEFLELWVSRDEGKMWERVGRADPSDGFFVYRASADGSHWFAVRSRDEAGHMYPGDDEAVQPALKVLIASQAEPTCDLPVDPPQSAEAASIPGERPVDPKVAYQVLTRIGKFGGPACGFAILAGRR